MPEQGLQVVEFQAVRCVLFEMPSGVFIPSDVGDRMGSQLHLAMLIQMCFANEPVLAVAKVEKCIQQAVK